MTELYKTYRPKDFEDVIGQEEIVQSLKKKIAQNEVPHTMLFSGSKGVGKTTVGRILRKKLKCSKWDFVEQNCADKRGIDSIRDIERTMNLSPMKGAVKMWLLDEGHMLTSESQDAALKMFEDTPPHVYFIICTTDAQKIKATIRSRCTEYAFRPFGSKDLRTLLDKICKAEKLEITDDVADKIISYADNSARNALVLLNKIKTAETEEEQLAEITKATGEMGGFQIAQTLFNPRAKWPDMVKVLKATEKEEPELMRWIIIGYAKSVLLGGGNMASLAYKVIQVFRDNWWDCKAAGLVACCYEIMVGENT